MSQKIKFGTWRQNYKRINSDPGNPIKKRYSSRFDDDGRLVLDEVGYEDVYDFIQSFRDECDINVLMKRFKAGEVDALQKVQGFYFDVVDTPKSLSDMLNKLNRGREEFEKLPAEFKEKYGNDFAQFICTFDPEQLVDAVSSPQIVGNLPKDDDVKESSDES